jgi:signal transduction histidine kinase
MSLTSRLLSARPLSRRRSQESQIAVDAPTRSSAVDTGEWLLMMDRDGAVLEAQRGANAGDQRLTEVVERLRLKAKFGELHPSLAAALTAAQRFGWSGSRLVLIPDLLSQPFPVLLEAVLSRQGQDGYEVALQSLSRDSAWLSSWQSLGQEDLLLLSLALTARRPGSIERVCLQTLPVLCELLTAEGAAAYTVSETGMMQLGAWVGSAFDHAPASLVAPDRSPSATDQVVPVGGLVQGDAQAIGWRGGRGQSGRIAWHRVDHAGELLGLLVFDRRAEAKLASAPQVAVVALEIVSLQLAALARGEAVASLGADLETAYSVTKAISRSLDIDSTFHHIAVSAASAVRDSSCLLFEFDEASSDLVVVAWSEPDVSSLRGLRFNLGSTDEARALLAQKTAIIVEDLRGDYGLPVPLADTLAMRSAVLVPIYAQSAPIGALLLYSRDVDREYAPADLRMAEHVADQAASAVANARLYRDLGLNEAKMRALLHKVSLVREQQRSALATIVHDEVTQLMVGAIYELEAVGARLQGQEAESVAKVLGTLRDATRRSREVIASLRSPLLGELGLAPALKTLGIDFEEETHVRCHVKCSGSAGLTEPVQVGLYRIAREALANVRKHSDAKHLRIALDASKEEVRLQISDDGHGVVVEDQTKPDHFGILIMQEQAAALGGSCTVENGRRGGVLVHVRIPQTIDTEAAE